MSHTILVVDDDAAIRTLVREFVSELALIDLVVEADDAASARARFAEHAPHLVLLDMNLPDGDGLDVLAHLRSAGDVPVVIITADSSSSRTIRAMQAGAYDYLVKPLEPETVRHVVRRALAHRRLSEEVDALQESLAGAEVSDRIIGVSAAMQAVYKLIGRVAASDVTVLITGETGTGKELVAETLHQNSPRRRGPLVRVNCAALPEMLLESELFGHEKGAFTGAIERRKGRFELASHGTIFLDEVGELEPSTQKKLLRVLQSGQFERVGGQVTLDVDVRVIAATNIDLEAAVESRRFREDLFYRLNVIRIDMPPLRERHDDIPALVAHFLDRYRAAPSAPPTKISDQAMGLLMNYDWPGNVRQLENAIQRAVVLSMGRPIAPEDLDLATGPFGGAPPPIDPAALVRARVPLAAAMADLARATSHEALRQAEGDADLAASWLDITPSRLAELASAPPAADDAEDGA